jgi:hypothetical protein
MGDQSVQTDGRTSGRLFYSRATWKWCFAWLPHRCDRSNQLIWLRYAYRGTVYYESVKGIMTDRAALTRRWLTTDEFLIGSLKGTINGYS